jgi:hypothetical protein
MDAGAAARMSDPQRNPHFRRRWREPACVRERQLDATTAAPDAARDRLDRLAALPRADRRRRRKLALGGGP